MTEKQGHYEKVGDVEEWVWDDQEAREPKVTKTTDVKPKPANGRRKKKAVK